MLCLYYLLWSLITVFTYVFSSIVILIYVSLICIKGTAEVVFTRRSDAIAALKRYNNVLLDGKAMKIEVIGNDLGLPMTPRINVVGASNGRATRTVVMT
jgi:RNA recognition motif-containing protein